MLQQRLVAVVPFQLSARPLSGSVLALSFLKFKYLVHLLSKDRFYLKEAVSIRSLEVIDGE
jgi:hypothetical protein